MSRGKKFVIGCCMIIGIGIIFCIVGISLGGKVTGINVGSGGVNVYASNAEENGKVHTYQIGDEELERFDSIKIDASYAEVTIQPAEHYGISYKLDERYEFSYEINNGVLVVSQKSPASMGISYSSFSIGNFGVFSSSEYSSNTFFEKEYITVYVPEGSKFQEVNINARCGDVNGNSFYADTLHLVAEYGDVELEKVESKNAELILDSGNLNISSFAEGDMSVENEYGNVTLKDIKAGQMNLKVVSGQCEAHEVTAEALTVEDEYGDITLEEIQTNGINLTADSGNISLVNVQTGECIAYSEYGNVDGKNLKVDSVLATAISGKITLEDMETKDVVVYSEYGDVDGYKIKTESFSGEVNNGNCKIRDLHVNSVDMKSEYGDVKLELATKLTDYSYDLKTEYGEISLENEDMGKTYKSLEEKDGKIKIYCESGNVQIEGTK